MPGDTVILTKGIGVGIYSAAFKKRSLPRDAYAEMMASTTLLNRIGQTLGEDTVCSRNDGCDRLRTSWTCSRDGARSGVSIDIAYDRIPFLSSAEALAEAGFATGASARNWASYGHEVVLPASIPATGRTLLSDPQTSGGLLIACATDHAEDIRSTIEEAGYPIARIIGIGQNRGTADQYFLVRMSPRFRARVTSAFFGNVGGRERESNPPGTGSLPHRI